MSTKYALSKFLTKFRFPNTILPNARISCRPTKFAGNNSSNRNNYYPQHTKTLQSYPSSLSYKLRNNNTELDRYRINHFNILNNILETSRLKRTCQYNSDFNLSNNNNNYYRHAETLQPLTKKYQHQNSLFFKFNDTDIGKKYRINHFIHMRNILETARLRWQHDSDFNLESFKKGARQVRNQSDPSLNYVFQTYYHKRLILSFSVFSFVDCDF